jgi:hypothetical protein
LVLKIPLELGLVLLVFITFMYVQHVFSLMPMYLSGEITSRPDAEEALISSATWSAIHIPVLGLWLLLWLWHRRLLRKSKGLAAPMPGRERAD